MNWLEQVGGLLQQYAGASPQQAPHSAQDDFQQFAQAAPPGALAHGLGAAFRSEHTPPFAQMVSQLFANSDGNQRAGLLNTLMGAVGPQVAAQALGGGGLAGLAGMLGGGGVSPHQAGQVPLDAVQHLAAQAESHNPSVADMVSGYFGQHPNLMQTLGPAALTAAMSGVAQHHQQGGVLPASMDPYGDPADQGYGRGGYGQGGVLPASQDPYGDPADQFHGQQVLDASQDPYGDPADQEPRRRGW